MADPVVMTDAEVVAEAANLVRLFPRLLTFIIGV